LQGRHGDPLERWTERKKAFYVMQEYYRELSKGF
jgi:hypothetical protein